MNLPLPLPMTWLVAALLAALIGLWFTWTRGLHAPALVLLVVTLVVVVLLGRRIEAGRDAGWQDAASRVHGTFRRAPPVAYLRSFGAPAPWDDWARDGELQSPRAIDGLAGDPPFALLQVRYSVRQRRGEEQPDAWYEVTVAAARLPHGVPAGGLPPPAPGGEYTGTHNGQYAFVWKKGRLGAGESLQATELPDLLQQVRRLVTQLSPAVAPGSSAAPAGPAPASPRTPP